MFDIEVTAFLTVFKITGLGLARLADLPADILTEANRVAEKLAALHAKEEEQSESSKIALRRKALLRVTSLPRPCPSKHCAVESCAGAFAVTTDCLFGTL